MRKEEYLERLAKCLKRLPKGEFDEAMEYFREYLEEAGPENEQSAIEDLGTPEAAAGQIIMNIAERNTENPGGKTIKKGLSSVWIGILAVFAAPVGIPLAAASVIVAASLVLSAIVCLLSVILCVACIAAGSVIGIFVGIYGLFLSVPDGMAIIGLSLMAGGLSILAVWLAAKITKLILRGLTCMFGKIIKRGGRKNEEK